MVSTCFYHLRRLRQLKHYVDRSVMQQLVSAFILICLNYCNSILIGLPWSAIVPLQQVQNAAAQPGNRPRDHVRSALQDLHRLPIPSHITFKVALLIFWSSAFTFTWTLTLTNQCPAYISEAVTSVSCGPSQRRLRASDDTNYTAKDKDKNEVRRESVLRRRTFHLELSSRRVRSATNKRCFKSRLRTYYFNIHFNTTKVFHFYWLCNALPFPLAVKTSNK